MIWSLCVCKVPRNSFGQVVGGDIWVLEVVVLKGSGDFASYAWLMASKVMNVGLWGELC